MNYKIILYIIFTMRAQSIWLFQYGYHKHIVVTN